MTLDTISASKPDLALSPAASGRLRGHARWFLGLVLPLGAALAWEIVVRSRSSLLWSFRC